MKPELLQRFCGHPANEIRVWITAPWREGGHIYATNGHMLVRIPDDGRDVAERGQNHPHVQRLFDGVAGVDGFAPIPSDLPQQSQCEACDGNGWHDGYRCGDCDGHGQFDHGNHNYDCKNCNASGQIEAENICSACGGFGSYGSVGDTGARTPVGDTGYQTRYLRFLATFPGMVLAPNGGHGAPFKFDGGEGIIMPMRGDR